MLLIGMLIGIVLHELAHVLAIKITKAGKVLKLHFSLKGLGIEWEPYDKNNYTKRIIVTLSGSLANLLVAGLCFAGGLVDIALANLIFGLINLLLPLRYADGRRAFTLWKEGINKTNISN